MMKQKSYKVHFTLAACMLLLSSIAFTQERARLDQALKEPYDASAVRHTIRTAAKGATIWANDFANVADWQVSHHPNGFALDWQVGTGLESTGATGTPAILSTTAANGYAMLCSDCGNNSGSTYEKSYLTTAAPIDLSAHPNIVLQFETQYRRYTDEQTYVAISTDGTTWPQPPSDTATVGLPTGLYPVWYDQELTQSISPGNPTIKRINISDAAGGQGTVWVRFYWYGIWGYAWYVDDVQIEMQPQYDLAITASKLSHSSSGVDYGRIPIAQYSGTLNARSSYENRGLADQTNVVLGASSSAFTVNGTVPTMIAGEQLEADLNTTAALTEQVYECTFEVTSDQDAQEDQPLDNSYVRRFEITSDVYSVDGVGNHPPGTQLLGQVGTPTYAGLADGLYVMSLYSITEPFTVHGLEVLLSNGTEAGGILIAYILDSASVINDDVSVPIVESTDMEIAPWNVNTGRIGIAFNSPVTLAPGAYYAAVQMFSAGNTNIIRIVDDVTFPQNGRASMIHSPANNQTYTNGNAYAVRLSGSPSVGIENVESDALWFDVSPNPSEGSITIQPGVVGEYQITLSNALGTEILNAVFTGTAHVDTGTLAPGVYVVSLNDGTRNATKKVIIK